MIPNAREMAMRYEREKAEFLLRGYNVQNAQNAAMENVRGWLLHAFVDDDEGGDGDSSAAIIERIKNSLYT